MLEQGLRSALVLDVTEERLRLAVCVLCAFACRLHFLWTSFTAEGCNVLQKLFRLCYSYFIYMSINILVVKHWYLVLIYTCVKLIVNIFIFVLWFNPCFIISFPVLNWLALPHQTRVWRVNLSGLDLTVGSLRRGVITERRCYVHAVT